MVEKSALQYHVANLDGIMSDDKPCTSQHNRMMGDDDPSSGGISDVLCYKAHLYGVMSGGKVCTGLQKRVMGDDDPSSGGIGDVQCYCASLDAGTSLPAVVGIWEMLWVMLTRPVPS